ncbi:MAG: GNAT family N-acetyltransferase [Myxococcota bacterium]
MTHALRIRPAAAADIPLIDALMAPQVRLGKLLPRTVVAADFLVACVGRRVVGAVCVTALSAGTAELGSLVVALRGRGIGRALVDAAMAEAAARGLGTVIALTDEVEFFERCGFSSASDTPWLRARTRRGLDSASPLRTADDVSSASEAKSATCAACSRLAACRQSMLVRRVAISVRSHA